MDTPVQTEKLSAALINIRIISSENAHTDGEEKIETINRVLYFTAPAIIENHGTLTGVSESGIEAVFKNSDNVLDGAFSVMRNASKKICDDSFDIAIGIHYGPVYITKAVYGDFVAPLAISDGMHTAHRLSKCALKYGASILITDSAAKNIRSFRSRFAARRLGAALSSDNGSEEILYDVFESDPTEIKYRKRRSRFVFENGVEMFLEGNYLKARSYFIELLKHDRNDIAAKKYVFMCDRAMSENIVSDENKYLEIWN